MISLTDNLVVEFQIDIVVFVPSSLIEPIKVEFAQTLQLLVYMGGYTEINNMVAHAWYQFHRAIVENVDLHHLVLPEVVSHDVVGNSCQHALGIFLRDTSCGDDEIVYIAGFGHDVAMRVNVIAFSIGIHNPDDWNTLLNVDAYVTTEGLVTFCIFHEGTLFQGLLNLSGIDGAHRLG